MASNKNGKNAYGLGKNLKMVISWPITVWAAFAGLLVCMLILVPWSVFYRILCRYFKQDKTVSRSWQYSAIGFY